MDVVELRARLKRAPATYAVYGDDGTEGRAAASTVAAVLVPIVVHPQGLTLLFTQRTTQLRSHSGQVAFPGGRAEPGDASHEFTALRETEEEIGLTPAAVEILARLPDYRTRTGYVVTPVIGLLTPPLVLKPDPREVAEVFEVPLDFLLDERNCQRRTREFQGQTVGYYVFEYQDRVIWGATAGMLVNLNRMLA
jgi:8-oxo-dGTP pyrophosphatase MutT (NUDIX family)